MKQRASRTPASSRDEAPVRTVTAPAAAPVAAHAIARTVLKREAGAAVRPADVAALQRTIGNRAVMRLLAAGRAPDGIQRWPSWSSVKNHILKGDFGSSDTPTGFHTKIGGSTTHQAYGTKTDIGNGVYEQSVKGRRRSTSSWKKKPKQSTFFPDKVGTADTTEDDLKNAVNSAGARSDKKVTNPSAWNSITLKAIGSTTVFPEGGSDRDAE
jgi:Bacterial EndoU nuclease